MLLPARHSTGSWLGDIKMIAQRDPRLAVAVLGGIEVIKPDMLGYGVPECGRSGWQILNLFGTFEAAAAGQTIPLQQNGSLNSDLWVKDVVYSVERPNAFEGSVLKAQSDHFNSLQPSMNFTLIVKGLCSYVISPDPTPLQNILQPFDCACPFGMIVGCNTTLSGTLNNRRALADDEVPTEVTITLHGIRLPTRYDSCELGLAVDALRRVNLLAP